MSQATRELSDGDVLFREGDAADCAYIVDEGKLEIKTSSKDGDVILTTLIEGEIVGEMGVIDGSSRTATATAVGATRLTVVTRNQFTERITEADPILRLLVNILLERYRSGLKSVKQRHQALEEGEVSTNEIVGDYIRHGIDKIRLEAELKEALSTGKLQVLYQPILSMKSRTIVGFEALARWDHPKRGPISPALFIALAEETSLIVPVGLFLFQEACKSIKSLESAAVDEDLFVSINVSAKQVADPTFLDQVMVIIELYGLNPQRLKLEITEGIELDMQKTREWVIQARALGFAVALDDFGTGYSSLDTIHKLDVNVVKIDRTFVIPLLDDARSRDLIRGLVSMMKTLGLEIVVEGIETQPQLEFVWALDCDFAQGYLMGKSMMLQDAMTLLQSSPKF